MFCLLHILLRLSLVAPPKTLVVMECLVTDSGVPEVERQGTRWSNHGLTLARHDTVNGKHEMAVATTFAMMWVVHYNDAVDSLACCIGLHMSTFQVHYPPNYVWLLALTFGFMMAFFLVRIRGFSCAAVLRGRVVVHQRKARQQMMFSFVAPRGHIIRRFDFVAKQIFGGLWDEYRGVAYLHGLYTANEDRISKEVAHVRAACCNRSLLEETTHIQRWERC